MLKEKIYLGTSNSIDLLFYRKVDGVWQQYSIKTATRVILSEVEGAWSLDSSEVSGVFDWNISGSPAKLKITAGGQTLTPGDYNCYIKIYFPGDSLGLRWGTYFRVEVVEA